MCPIENNGEKLNESHSLLLRHYNDDEREKRGLFLQLPLLHFRIPFSVHDLYYCVSQIDQQLDQRQQQRLYCRSLGCLLLIRINLISLHADDCLNLRINCLYETEMFESL